MSDPPAAPSDPKRRRFRLRFGLKSLLALLVVAGVIFGTVGRRMANEWRRDRSRTALTQMGAQVAWLAEPGTANLVERMWQHGLAFSPASLYVTFADPNMNDETLARAAGHLAAFPDDVILALAGSAITAQGLKHLEGQAGIRGIFLMPEQFTPQSGATLATLPRLEALGIGGTTLGDANLKNLGALPQVERVFLAGPALSDAGLAHLGGLPKLKHLTHFQTQFTKPGLEALAARRPGLSVKKFDPVASSLVQRPITTGAVRTLQWSADGAVLASGSGDGSLHLWQPGQTEPIARVAAHDNWTFDIAFSPDGTLLATGGGDDRVKLWQLPHLAGSKVFEGHLGDVHAVAFTPDGTRLVSTSDDATVRVWSIIAERKELLKLEGHTESIPSLAVSPDGKLAASAGRDDTIILWNLESGVLVRRLEGHTDDVLEVVFSADGQTLASASYDQTIRLWKVADGSVLRIFRGHTDRAFTVAFSPDGQRLASGAGDGTARLWDIESGKQVAELSEQIDVSHLAFSPDGRLLATASSDESICLWELATGRIISKLWPR